MANLILIGLLKCRKIVNDIVEDSHIFPKEIVSLLKYIFVFGRLEIWFLIVTSLEGNSTLPLYIIVQQTQKDVEDWLKKQSISLFRFSKLEN